ncbi:MAG: HEAT repeat domain-containing protein [Planctomycetes bacterium]|nr:HEAT repeat domain-containing protein [Planctomycetota bacterium]
MPYPVYDSTPTQSYTSFAQAPSTTVTHPAPEEVKTVAAAQEEKKPKTMEDFIHELSSKKARVRGEAAAALGKFGDKAKEAIPALIKLLKDNDPNVRLEATITLAKIGPDSVPALTRALESQNKLTRMGAALSLGHLGSAAKRAEPELKKLLKDTEEDVRCHAAQALFRIDPQTAETVVPVLSSALDSLDPYIRLCAMGTLSRIGPAAKDAVAKLKNCLKDEDYHLRMSAAIALGHIDPSQDAGAIDTLRIALQEPSPAVRMEAAQILGELGAKAKPVIQSIGKLLSDSNAGVSRAAAIALSRIGPDAIPELEKALKSESVDVRRNAVVALINLGETAKEAAPALRIAAKDGDETVRLLAMNGLKNMEEEEKEKSAPKK